MTKRKKINRRKSSDSDNEHLENKQCRHSVSISDAISEPNSVLFDVSGCEKEADQEPKNGEDPDLVSKANMATGACKGDDLKDIRIQMGQVLATVTEIKSSQESMRRAFDSKLDKMRNEFLSTIDGKMRSLRDEINIDIGRESNRIDSLLTSLNTLNARLESVEKSTSQFATGASTETLRHTGSRPSSLDDHDVCIVISGIPAQEGENVTEKAENVIHALGEEVASNVLVTGAKRLRSYIAGKPGLVKVSFQNTHEKVLVLRNKSNLKNSENYKKAYIKSSKSYAERLIEQNAKTLLRQMPHGNQFRVDNNGRIRERRDPAEDNPGH